MILVCLVIPQALSLQSHKYFRFHLWNTDQWKRLHSWELYLCECLLKFFVFFCWLFPKLKLQQADLQDQLHLSHHLVPYEEALPFFRLTCQATSLLAWQSSHSISPWGWKFPGFIISRVTWERFTWLLCRCDPHEGECLICIVIHFESGTKLEIPNKLNHPA